MSKNRHSCNAVLVLAVGLLCYVVYILGTDVELEIALFPKTHRLDCTIFFDTRMNECFFMSSSSSRVHFLLEKNDPLCHGMEIRRVKTVPCYDAKSLDIPLLELPSKSREVTILLLSLMGALILIIILANRCRADLTPKSHKDCKHIL